MFFKGLCFAALALITTAVYGCVLTEGLRCQPLPPRDVLVRFCESQENCNIPTFETSTIDYESLELDLDESPELAKPPVQVEPPDVEGENDLYKHFFFSFIIHLLLTFCYHNVPHIL